MLSERIGKDDYLLGGRPPTDEILIFKMCYYRIVTTQETTIRVYHELPSGLAEIFEIRIR